jgi:short-subunit dehydrogenase
VPGESERAAIVIGASRAIGLALAETLAAEGYNLTISARKLETLGPVADRLREIGREVEFVAANLADPDSIAHVVA